MAITKRAGLSWSPLTDNSWLAPPHSQVRRCGSHEKKVSGSTRVGGAWGAEGETRGQMKSKEKTEVAGRLTTACPPAPRHTLELPRIRCPRRQRTSRLRSSTATGELAPSSTARLAPLDLMRTPRLRPPWCGRLHPRPVHPRDGRDGDGLTRRVGGEGVPGDHRHYRGGSDGDSSLWRWGTGEHPSRRATVPFPHRGFGSHPALPSPRSVWGVAPPRPCHAPRRT